jgi:hypothetical protein
VESSPSAPLDAAELLTALARHDVDCVLIGGTHPEDLIRMKSAAAGFRDRPEAKRRQDLDDIAVLERLRAERDGSAASRLMDDAHD